MRQYNDTLENQSIWYGPAASSQLTDKRNPLLESFLTKYELGEVTFLGNIEVWHYGMSLEVLSDPTMDRTVIIGLVEPLKKKYTNKERLFGSFDLACELNGKFKIMDTVQDSLVISL